MKPSHKCSIITNNNVIKTLSKLKLHVESIPEVYLHLKWVWEPLRRRSLFTTAVFWSEIEKRLPADAELRKHSMDQMKMI